MAIKVARMIVSVNLTKMTVISAVKEPGVVLPRIKCPTKPRFADTGRRVNADGVMNAAICMNDLILHNFLSKVSWLDGLIVLPRNGVGEHPLSLLQYSGRRSALLSPLAA